MPKTRPRNVNNSSAPTEKHKAAYFLSLTVENVRCFGERQVLDLSDGHGRPARWTILVGNNGTGKTTLLQVLAGFEPDPSSFRGSAMGDTWPRAVARYLPAGGTFFYTRAGSMEGKVACTIAVGDPLSFNGRTLSSIKVTLDYPPGGFGFDPDPLPPLLHLLRCYGYGASRRLGNTSLSNSTTGDAVASLFSDTVELHNAEEWLLRLDYSASKSSEIQDRQRQQLEQVKHLLINLLPEVEDIRFTSPGTTNPTPRVEFQTPYGWVPLRQLGYGYQTLIAWVTDLANRMVERYPDSPNPLAEPAIVLVDEIDLHLHPVWQRELLGFLSKRFPNTQFIATAHSPLVVQAAGEANLAVLRREGDHVVIDNDVDSIRGWRVDQILTSELFGLPSARPPQYDAILTRRRELLSKSTLTSKEKKELEELEKKMKDLPVGETAEQAKELQLLRSALELLQKNRQNGA
jgi:energy-coupling factor transporter ATP-binding protein EcfA2